MLSVIANPDALGGVDAFARVLGVSRWKLQRDVKEATSLSPSELLDWWRCALACGYAHGMRRPLREAVRLAGFSSRGRARSVYERLAKRDLPTLADDGALRNIILLYSARIGFNHDDADGAWRRVLDAVLTEAGAVGLDA
jgi:methylphosphotriester-DNA--protein-cysteine methyltransferase